MSLFFVVKCLFLIYLEERDTEMEMFSTCWFIPQIPILAMLGQAEAGAHSSIQVLCGVAGTQVLKTSSVNSEDAHW